MKITKILSLLAIVLLLLCGCYRVSVINARTIEGYYFTESDNKKDYNLRFALCDENGEFVRISADVDIKIVNTAGATVYEATLPLKESDFGEYNTVTGEKGILANLKIPKSKVKVGKAFNGTAYFTVYRGEDFSFNETACEVPYILPVEEFKITAPKLPMVFEYYQVVTEKEGPVSKLRSKITVKEIDYRVVESRFPYVELSVKGEKNFGQAAVGADAFDYELCDSKGKVVSFGSISVAPTKEGEKFTDKTVNFTDLIPGEEYTIRFSEIEAIKFRY